MTKREIVHIEIPSADHKESGDFYGALFGWKMTPMPEANYMLWEPEAGPGGGFSSLSDSTVGEVLLYVDSDDIEADLRRAAELGGRILREKAEIPGMGWWGMFADPTGNKIAVYTSMNPRGQSGSGDQ